MTEPSNHSRSAPPQPATTAPLEICLRDVHKSFGANHVLTGISLDVPRGQMVAIVGGSGSGKTVLLRLIMGHFQPNAGHVYVADHESPGSPLTDLATLDEHGMDRLRRHWAMVFQGNALFAGSVYDNVALALREVKGMDEADIRQRVFDSLRAVELDPDKVATLDRAELSGGMAKRVGLARAIALEPLLIFYDEPTSGLDPQLSGQIHQLILNAHQKTPDPSVPRTTLIVTHDKDLLYRLQPRVVMLHHGRIFFDGPYEQFARSDSAVVKPYFNFMPELHLRCKDVPS